MFLQDEQPFHFVHLGLKMVVFPHQSDPFTHQSLPFLRPGLAQRSQLVDVLGLVFHLLLHSGQLLLVPQDIPRLLIAVDLSNYLLALQLLALNTQQFFKPFLQPVLFSDHCVFFVFKQSDLIFQDLDLIAELFASVFEQPQLAVFFPHPDAQ